MKITEEQIYSFINYVETEGAFSACEQFSAERRGEWFHVPGTEFFLCFSEEKTPRVFLADVFVAEGLDRAALADIMRKAMTFPCS